MKYHSHNGYIGGLLLLCLCSRYEMLKVEYSLNLAGHEYSFQHFNEDMKGSQAD